ncbi:Small RNA degrading nuclease 5 [Cucumispora dikerogammari]|nr:Small RNA degrading nuclease 5 [Cucumispora dikerogammari]
MIVDTDNKIDKKKNNFNKNIRLKRKMSSVISLRDISKLINWIYNSGKKPSYISILNYKPIRLNIYFLETASFQKTEKYTGVLYEYLSLSELKLIIQSGINDLYICPTYSRNKLKTVDTDINEIITSNDILRFRVKNYKTIYNELGPKINLKHEFPLYRLETFWSASTCKSFNKRETCNYEKDLEKNRYIINNKKMLDINKTLILDCEMVEIIDLDSQSTSKIKTINYNTLKTYENVSSFPTQDELSASPENIDFLPQDADDLRKTWQNRCKKPIELNISSKLQMTSNYHIQPNYKKHIARVTIINLNKDVVLDSYILPQYPIINFHTSESGITPALIEDKGITLKHLYKLMREIIYPDTTLIGHSIGNDLLSLSIHHKNIIDTSRLFSKRGYKESLKKLSKRLFNKNIQSGQHSSLEDALMTRLLFLIKCKQYRKLFSQCKKSRKNNEILYNIYNISNFSEIITDDDKSINLVFTYIDNYIYFLL